MKTKLLLLVFCGILNLNAQTTYDLIWERDFLSPESDLTILAGDTVRWTWTDENHTVENVPGSSVETFNSGFMGPIGSQWSYTFTVVGDNDYFCGIHGADDMSGTITVLENLSVPEEELNTFSMFPNPASSEVTLKLPSNSDVTEINLFNLLGENVISKSFKSLDEIQLDLLLLNSGLYIIKVSNGEHSQSKHLIKL